MSTFLHHEGRKQTTQISLEKETDRQTDTLSQHRQTYATFFELLHLVKFAMAVGTWMYSILAAYCISDRYDLERTSVAFLFVQLFEYNIIKH